MDQFNNATSNHEDQEMQSAPGESLRSGQIRPKTEQIKQVHNQSFGG